LVVLKVSNQSLKGGELKINQSLDDMRRAMDSYWHQIRQHLSGEKVGGTSRRSVEESDNTEFQFWNESDACSITSCDSSLRVLIRSCS